MYITLIFLGKNVYINLTNPVKNANLVFFNDATVGSHLGSSEGAHSRKHLFSKFFDK